MARVRLSALIDRIRGSVGDYVLKMHGNDTILTRKATHEGHDWSPKQDAWRDRFRAATEYGRRVGADPELRRFYEAKARRKKKQMAYNALANGDFLKPPVVEEIDASGYHGSPGDVIRISARDDMGVVAVHVILKDANGAVIEEGAAVDKIRHWVYTATASATADTTVRIEATAIDRPGGWVRPRSRSREVVKVIQTVAAEVSHGHATAVGEVFVQQLVSMGRRSLGQGIPEVDAARFWAMRPEEGFLDRRILFRRF